MWRHIEKMRLILGGGLILLGAGGIFLVILQISGTGLGTGQVTGVVRAAVELGGRGAGDSFRLGSQSDNDQVLGRLKIESIGVRSAILGGNSEGILDKEQGVWLDTAGSLLPGEEGGNVVLAGHRFRFLPPNNTTLFNLDSVESGDLIALYWGDREFSYRVHELQEVEPTDTWIRDQPSWGEEGDSFLTIYTCTPVFTGERRLVLQAVLVSD